MNTMIVNKAKSLLTEMIPIVEQKYGIKIPSIIVKSSSRMVRSFGRAEFSNLTGRYTIKIAEYVYAHHTESKAFRNTVAHELAHIAEHIAFKRFSHSSDWARIMHAMGEQPNRFATVEKKAEIEYVRPPKRQMTKYVHKCAGGCKHTVGGQVHNKILRGAMYTCKRTGRVLEKTFEVVKP